MRKLKKLMYIVFMLFFLSVMLYSGYQIYTILSDYKEGEDIYAELEDGFKVRVTVPAVTEAPTVTEVPTELSSAETVTVTDAPEVTETPAAAEVSSEAVQESQEESAAETAEGSSEDTTLEEMTESEPETEEETTEEEPLPDYSEYEHQEDLFLFTIPLNYVLTPQYALDFTSLLKLNSDVKGWITIEGTNVDYPMVQAADNDYYLRKTIDHTNNNAGSIFIECLVEAPFAQKNTIIYGHNQKNKKMFHELMYYQEKEYYEKNPLIDVYLPDGRHQVYEVYSAYLTDSGSLTYQIYFGSEDAFANYIAYTKEQSFYKTNAAVSGSDRIITLSTCTNEDDMERMIVHARLFAELTQ